MSEARWRWITEKHFMDLQTVNAKLLAALEACDVVMSTARDHGVGDILPPAYRDSWELAHKEAIAAIATAKEVLK